MIADDAIRHVAKTYGWTLDIIDRLTVDDWRLVLALPPQNAEEVKKEKIEKAKKLLWEKHGLPAGSKLDHQELMIQVMTLPTDEDENENEGFDYGNF